MTWLSDAWDGVVDTVEDGWDATGRKVLGVSEDAFRAIPGGDEVIELLHDFANTGVGEAVFRAVATMAYQYLAYTPLGLQFAAVAFAIPGLVKGDRFDEAWLVEFKYRVEKTAEILLPGIADKLGAMLTETLGKMAAEYGAGEVVDLTVQEIAKRYNVREDVAAFALALWNRVQLPSRDTFDPATGKQIKPWASSPNIAQRSREQQRREYAAIFGAREYDALGYGEREDAVLVALAQPKESARSSATSSSSDVVGYAALAVVGIGALVAWRRGLL